MPKIGFIKPLLITLCLFVLPVYAEPPQSLTLEQALTLATENNPQFKAAQARLGVSQADILAAMARLNPSLMSDNGIAEGTSRIGVEQTFELGGKRHKRIAVAEAQQQVVLAELNTTLLNLRTNVRRSYTQFFNAQEREKSYQDIVQTTERLLDIATKREQTGDIAKLDVLSARIARTNARNDFQTAFYQVIEARNRFSALLNQPISASVQLAPPAAFSHADLVKLPTIPPSQTTPLQGSVQEAVANLDKLIEQALADRPEMKENLKRLDVVQKQLALAQANRVPNLTLAAGPDIVYRNPNNTVNDISVYMSGNLEIPLFNRQQGPIQQALAQKRQLEQEQQALKNQITYEVINAHTAFIASQERIKQYETQLLPDAQEVVEMSQRSFQEGKSAILTSINAQQAYINTRLGYLQALMDYQNAISDLERAIGSGL